MESANEAKANPETEGHEPGCSCLDCVMPAEEFNAAIREVAGGDFSEEICDRMERLCDWDRDLLDNDEDDEDLSVEDVIY